MISSVFLLSSFVGYGLASESSRLGRTNNVQLGPCEDTLANSLSSTISANVLVIAGR